MDDFNLKKGKPVVTTDRDFVKQQIDLLFDSKKGELQGYHSWGTNYDECLWELSFSESEMEAKMRDDLGKLDLRGFEITSVDCYLVPGTEDDIMILSVVLDKNYEHIESLYKIV